MSPPQLNVDVLTIICQFLTDVPDVLSLALTSSSVHPIATRWLLHMDTISLTKETSIRKFHSFLFADAPARAPHVLALDIDISSGWPFYQQIRDDTANIPLLIDIITSCSHARQISIALQHTLDPLNPDIVNAIATLKTLRSLTVVGPVPNAVVLIREVTSPLRRVVVCSREVMNSYWCPAALEQCLARLALSLEELEVYIRKNLVP